MAPPSQPPTGTGPAETKESIKQNFSIGATPATGMLCTLYLTLYLKLLKPEACIFSDHSFGVQRKVNDVLNLLLFLVSKAVLNHSSQTPT